MISFVLAGCVTVTPTQEDSKTIEDTKIDPYLWLEEVEGERALSWVREQNAITLAELHADPRFDQFESEA
ncbi:MAG: hypothetical protein HOD43_02230, partial [Candidatus Marinimicrobia bacterium]|nr:hypothetical protein [Candidatus Neomarinimicrobiota bacterium]